MGKTKTVAEWSKETGIDVKILYARLSRKWTVERALTTPVGQDKWHK
nr:MAG TPA: PVL ORF-50-like family [Bacteriophage sp.]